MEGKVYSWGSFKVVIPIDWDGEEEEGLITLCDPVGGVGALQFSLYTVENAKDVALKEDLADLLDNSFSGEITSDENCAQTEYMDDLGKRYWKYWLIQKETRLIFGSYNCDIKNKGIEAREVAQIIKSIIKD